MNIFSSWKLTLLVILISISGVLFAQEIGTSVAAEIDPASYVAYTLEKLYETLGMPSSVYAVRGNEAWQDDVVFVYPAIEVYIFEDRVWQVCPASVYNMMIGDTVDTIKTVMGDPLVTTENFLLYQLPSTSWPMMMRINLNDEENAESFFIYRSDF
jgi:hypothetical protein